MGIRCRKVEINYGKVNGEFETYRTFDTKKCLHSNHRVYYIIFEVAIRAVMVIAKECCTLVTAQNPSTVSPVASVVPLADKTQKIDVTLGFARMSHLTCTLMSSTNASVAAQTIFGVSSRDTHRNMSMFLF